MARSFQGICTHVRVTTVLKGRPVFQHLSLLGGAWSFMEILTTRMIYIIYHIIYDNKTQGSTNLKIFKLLSFFGNRETGSQYVGQASFKLSSVFPPLPTECWMLTLQVCITMTSQSNLSVLSVLPFSIPLSLISLLSFFWLVLSSLNFLCSQDNEHGP